MSTGPRRKDWQEAASTVASKLIIAAIAIVAIAAGAHAIVRGNAVPSTVLVAVGQENGGSTKADQYNPASVGVNAGDTVRWEWFGGTHDVTSYAEASPGTPEWQSELIRAAGHFFERQFAVPGAYTYYCSIHALPEDAAPAVIDGNIAAGKMVGKVVVSAPVTPSPSPSPSPTVAPTASPTPTPQGASSTPTPAASATPAVTPSASPAPTGASTPTPAASGTPAASSTPAPTVAPTATPIPVETSTPAPTEDPQPTATSAPTATPPETPSPAPTGGQPTVTPPPATPVVTPAPTPTGTGTPAPATKTATPAPTAAAHTQEPGGGQTTPTPKAAAGAVPTPTVLGLGGAPEEFPQTGAVIAREGGSISSLFRILTMSLTGLLIAIVVGGFIWIERSQRDQPR